MDPPLRRYAALKPSVLGAVAGCLLVGAVLTLAGLLVTGNELLPLSTWDPEQAGLSNYEEVRVWGWPLVWVEDHPYRPAAGRIDLPAEARAGTLVADWLFLSLGVLYVATLGRLLRWRSPDGAPSPDGPCTGSMLFAASIAPYSSFFVVQALLPAILFIDPAGTGDLAGEMRFASEMAFYATCAAYAVILALGLPICWMLRRKRRFALRYLLPIGVLAGAGPFLPAFVGTVASSIRSFDDVGSPAHALAFVILGGGSGLASAYVLWRVAMTVQRDRSVT